MLFLSYKKSVFSPLVFCSLLLLNSCQKPDTKEDYLNKFKNFVGRVDRYHQDYSKNDWEWADQRFEMFSVHWYNEFEDELSEREKLDIIALKLEYRSMKEPNVISDLLDDLKNEKDEIKQRLDEYIEKDFDQDIEELLDGLTEIGDSAVEMMGDILEKIDNRF